MAKPRCSFCSPCSNFYSQKIVSKKFVAHFQGFSENALLALTMLFVSCLYDNKVTRKATSHRGDTIADVIVRSPA
jgi:hypothetical protein